MGLYKCKYFSPDEFSRIPSAEGKDIQDSLKMKLDKARGYAGFPFVITSAFRTVESNKAAGGVSDSAHCSGLAVDIKNDYTNKVKTAKLIQALTLAGFKRLGIANTFIHADIDDKKIDAIWDYS